MSEEETKEVVDMLVDALKPEHKPEPTGLGSVLEKLPEDAADLPDEDADPPEKPTDIVGEGQRPCGCFFRKLRNGQEQTNPCPPHGMKEAAEALMFAGQRFAGAADRLIAAQEDAQVAKPMKKKRFGRK
jgi:hypothetical protein